MSYILHQFLSYYFRHNNLCWTGFWQTGVKEKPVQESPYIDNCFVFPCAYTIFTQSDYFFDEDYGNIIVNHTHLPHQYQSKSLLIETIPFLDICIFLFSFTMTNCHRMQRFEIHVDFDRKKRKKKKWCDSSFIRGKSATKWKQICFSRWIQIFFTNKKHHSP